MPLDYGSESSIFHAPVMRIDDAGHGFVGVVYQADKRQATDFDSGELKWFANKKLIVTNSPPAGADPVPEYVFHVAVEKGKGAFTKRDANGDPVKLGSGKNATEVRDIVEDDIAFVTGAAWLTKAVKAARLNEGHRVRLKRLTPARDENGDRYTSVECELEILGTVDNPRPYKAVTVPADAIYGDDDGGF